jgi:hypothetical protein
MCECKQSTYGIAFKSKAKKVVMFAYYTGIVLHLIPTGMPRDPRTVA